MSCDSQEGQHGGGIPHKSPRGFTVVHPERHLLLWSQDKFVSLRADHVLGVLNLAADFLSRQKLRPGEWMLNHQTVAQIWDLFGEAEVDLFASQESSQCPLWFSLSSPAPLGIDTFAHPWPNVRLRISASQANSGSPVQGEGERCPSSTCSPVLAIPDVILRVDSSSVSAPLGDSNQAGPALLASGQDLASSARDLEGALVLAFMDLPLRNTG